MNDQELRTLEADVSIDARGTACPGPLLAAKKGMPKVPKGGVMEVLSSDEGTNRDIPMWAKKKRHEMLGIVEDDGYWRLYLRRKK
jgi:TusA-related sulfurtransferase